MLDLGKFGLAEASIERGADGALSLRFQAEELSTERLLRGRLIELRDGLEGRGLEIRSLSVAAASAAEAVRVAEVADPALLDAHSDSLQSDTQMADSGELESGSEHELRGSGTDESGHSDHSGGSRGEYIADPELELLDEPEVGA